MASALDDPPIAVDTSVSLGLGSLYERAERAGSALLPIRFDELCDADRAAVRDAQRATKVKKRRLREERQLARAAAAAAVVPLPAASMCSLLSAASSFPRRISSESYFGACSGGRFRDPCLPPNREALALVLSALESEDASAPHLNSCCYFQFSGDEDAVWDATFNARLAWEGFFTITAHSREFGAPEPLPELQPFYGVLTWPMFHAAKQVKTHISKLRKGQVSALSDASLDLDLVIGTRVILHGLTSAAMNGKIGVVAGALGAQKEGRYSVRLPGRAKGVQIKASNLRKKRQPFLRLVDSAERGERWAILDAYHRAKNGSNWLTRRYVEMLMKASDDPRLNFRMHVICLLEGDNPEEHLGFAERERLAFHPTTNADGGRREPPAQRVLGGEIGFSVGRVYTSLSGWTAARSSESHGTTQLILLGLWLEQRGYAFWSLGHCYSPELEYKHALGHAIYPRWKFIELLRKYRGEFYAPGSERDCAQCGVAELKDEAGDEGGGQRRHQGCARCGEVFYCSKACQRSHWKTKPVGHKRVCVAKQASAAVEVDSAAAEWNAHFSPIGVGDEATAVELLRKLK